MFTGPELNGNLLPGGSASWQIALPDGTALVEIRYTLRTDRGALLYVRSSGVGHCNPTSLAEAPPAMQRHALKPLHRTWTGSTGVSSSPSRAARR